MKLYFDTQGEAMTQARRIADSGYMARPYVYYRRRAQGIQSKWWDWCITDGPPFVIERARIEAHHRKNR